jgi:hypothetical protein
MLQQSPKWLLFFSTVPAKPGNLRMKIWRRLLKLGAVSLKGSVYVLPFSEDHLEVLHWLQGEVVSLGGEAAFVQVTRIETMADTEIVALFRVQRDSEYAPIRAALEDLEVHLTSLEQQLTAPGLERLKTMFQKILKDYRSVRAVDFFQAAPGSGLPEMLERVEKTLRQLSGRDETPKPGISGPRIKKDYLGRVWVTRRRPFVDRMASAWLIRRFIDGEARFEFLEKEQEAAPGMVSFDVPGGDFSHEEDRCTFEVLLTAFNLRGKALRKIAEMVHDLDLKDGKFASPQAAGLESILLGIRRTAATDQDALEEGIKIFARLHAALVK